MLSLHPGPESAFSPLSSSIVSPLLLRRLSLPPPSWLSSLQSYQAVTAYRMIANLWADKPAAADCRSLKEIRQLISFTLHIRKSFPTTNHSPAGTFMYTTKLMRLTETPWTLPVELPLCYNFLHSTLLLLIDKKSGRYLWFLRWRLLPKWSEPIWGDMQIQAILHTSCSCYLYRLWIYSTSTQRELRTAAHTIWTRFW